MSEKEIQLLADLRKMIWQAENMFFRLVDGVRDEATCSDLKEAGTKISEISEEIGRL